MTDQNRDHDQSGSDARPTPAPTGTGGGGGQGEQTARPIPADHQEGRESPSGNTPDDGSSPGDVDRDSQPNRQGEPATGVKPDGRPEGEGPASTPADVNKTTGDDEQSAADADGASAAAAAAGAEAEAAEPEPDWKDRYVRSVAELDNVRKRARRDAALGEARGIAKLAKELLPALDNLDRALAHVDADPAGAGDGQLVEGLRIVHREIHAALSQAGIEAYDPTGEPFDPHAHEALTQQPAPEGTPSGTILAVYQAGYRRGDDVLRAAKVVVAG
jgi:molecular chaperone GrpE